MASVDVIAEVTSQPVIEGKQLVIPLEVRNYEFHYCVGGKQKSLEDWIKTRREIKFPHPEPSRIVLTPNDLIRLKLERDIHSDSLEHFPASLDLIGRSENGSYRILASYHANGGGTNADRLLGICRTRDNEYATC